MVETIKSEVSQRHWAQREWTNLRRIELEALIEKMHECEAYLGRRRTAALAPYDAEKDPALVAGLPRDEERDVISEFRTISDIYFPELWKETGDFVQACREESAAHWDSQNRYRARGALRDAARALLVRIMNVDEGT